MIQCGRETSLQMCFYLDLVNGSGILSSSIFASGSRGNFDVFPGFSLGRVLEEALGKV